MITEDLAALCAPIDPSDFYGIVDAIAEALREAQDDPPDEALLSPKAHRRLRMALTAAIATPDPLTSPEGKLAYECGRLKAELAEALARLRACERDAQRYAYLRRMADYVAVHWTDPEERGVAGAYGAKELDAAIDAASTPTPGKE